MLKKLGAQRRTGPMKIESIAKTNVFYRFTPEIPEHNPGGTGGQARLAKNEGRPPPAGGIAAPW